MNPAIRKILIVEDDQIIANIYRNKFEKAGYEVEIAADGQAGFYRVHELRPSAVLLDLMLPHMNGVEILRKIRAQKKFEKLPVFVFTNAYLSEFAHQAAEAGANQVFNKSSSSPQQIVEAINTALGVPSTVSAPLAVSAASSPAPSPASISAPPPPPRPRFEPTSSSAPVASVPPPPQQDSDAVFQAELSKVFTETASDNLANLRKLLAALTKADTETVRLAQLIELYRKVHSLTGNAAIAGFHRISQLCSPLEALLRELHEKPKNINPSTLRTIAQAVDFLGVLFDKGASADRQEARSTNILVVDDEVISRRAVIYAIEKANLKAVGVEDPLMAARLLEENTFDLVILDVEMPGMNGFDLCAKLRTIPAHKTTPVIFVTGLSDFESRARSSLSGGNDLIAKPFLFIELAVKALTYVLRERLAAPAA